MRIIRLLLILTVLLAMAQPTFACPTCGPSDCIPGHPGDLRCQVTMDGCVDGTQSCGFGATVSMASEWTVASVEVSRPATAPATTVTARTTRVADASSHVKSLR
jgi:hypothetical protein